MDYQDPKACKLIKKVSKRLDRMKYVDGLYERCKQIRPMFLFFMREFQLLQVLVPFMRTCFRKSYEFQKDVDARLDLIAEIREENGAGSAATKTEYKYLTWLVKNFKTFRRTCLQNTLQQFGKLPGHLPLDLRSHIVSYISTIPIQ